MALQMATDSFFVTEVLINRGDIYDSAQALVIASPGHWVALPAGTPASHRAAGQPGGQGGNT